MSDVATIISRSHTHTHKTCFHGESIFFGNPSPRRKNFTLFLLSPSKWISIFTTILSTPFPISNPPHSPLSSPSPSSTSNFSAASPAAYQSPDSRHRRRDLRRRLRRSSSREGRWWWNWSEHSTSSPRGWTWMFCPLALLDCSLSLSSSLYLFCRLFLSLPMADLRSPRPCLSLLFSPIFR